MQSKGYWQITSAVLAFVALMAIIAGLDARDAEIAANAVMVA